MEHTTAPIANIVKDTVLDAVQHARKALRFIARPRFSVGDEAIARRSKAEQAVAVLDWVNAHIVADQHDATLAMSIGNVIADMLDLSEGELKQAAVKDAAARLRLASLLLFSARRERDLDGRLRAILKVAHGISADADDIASDEPTFPQDHQSMAADIVTAAQSIARLARA